MKKCAKMPCGHDRSEVVSSDEGTNYCGACEREAREMPVNSMGKCFKCGYEGPGPGHRCRPKVEEF